ncbi:hypothetical protein M9H77_26969 [Catharanthus roseus]|uniref:Uncharacterized protein n=1 Tax=Catharanthus roseus TaxID=4058 RepID=A0ACC0AC66_CATRO|nr:hypothetical protein M9H77_26969 [Catharanthus roseus]
MTILVPNLHPDYGGEKELFGENQVNGRVSGLHCTWLVPCTTASSEDVDRFLTLRVDPLKEGRSTWRAWPNRLTQDVPRGTQISYSAVVDLVAELGRAWYARKFTIEKVFGSWDITFNILPKYLQAV